MMQPAMVPASILEERSQLGHDRFDEVWDGVLHMVPAPSTPHQLTEGALFIALSAIVKARCHSVIPDVAIHDPAMPGHKNYRIPDIAVAEERDLSQRGIEGRAFLAVEILSPDDESRAKLPFYARVGVQEVWLVDPRAKTIEVFRGLTPIAPIDGVIEAPALGVRVSVVGDTLRIAHGADTYEVRLRDSV